MFCDDLAHFPRSLLQIWGRWGNIFQQISFFLSMKSQFVLKVLSSKTDSAENRYILKAFSKVRYGDFQKSAHPPPVRALLRFRQISSTLGQISFTTRLDIIHNSARSHPHSARSHRIFRGFRFMQTILRLKTTFLSNTHTVETPSPRSSLPSRSPAYMSGQTHTEPNTDNLGLVSDDLSR